MGLSDNKFLIFFTHLQDLRRLQHCKHTLNTQENNKHLSFADFLIRIHGINYVSSTQKDVKQNFQDIYCKP